LLSFLAATFFLGEPANSLSVLGVALIVCGILLVSGLLLSGTASAHHKAPRAGVAFGLLIGVFIAAYTINDGWAVKVLMISPFIIDFTGNALRIALLAPSALRNRAELVREAREYRTSILVVSVLGPLGYILVLFAMQLAPIGHVAPARELATLVGSYFGVKLLKERMTPQRVIGAILIVGGVISLSITRPGQ
jgi:drug/metabolite transporter (DMT)-like permease